MDTDNTTPPFGLEPLLDVNELAAYLGVPVSTVYDWRTNGKGPRVPVRQAAEVRHLRRSGLDRQHRDAIRGLFTAPAVRPRAVCCAALPSPARIDERPSRHPP
jgi:hypothetical protein